MTFRIKFKLIGVVSKALQKLSSASTVLGNGHGGRGRDAEIHATCHQPTRDRRCWRAMRHLPDTVLFMEYRPRSAGVHGEER